MIFAAGARRRAGLKPRPYVFTGVVPLALQAKTQGAASAGFCAGPKPGRVSRTMKLGGPVDRTEFVSCDTQRDNAPIK